jgi:hypothetical protein
LDDADRAAIGGWGDAARAHVATLEGRPRLVDDARETVSMRRGGGGSSDGSGSGGGSGGGSGSGGRGGRGIGGGDGSGGGGGGGGGGRGEGGDDGPLLQGQIDGVARGVVYGWACEVGPANNAEVAVYVDGFLVVGCVCVVPELSP